MRAVDQAGHVRIVARHQAQLRVGAFWKCDGFRIGVRFQETIDLSKTFLAEDRTDGVKKPAARFDDRPESFQQAFLLLREGNNIFGTSGKHDFWMTTDDAACRAGSIQKNGVKRLFVPPLLQFTGVADLNFSLKPKSGKVFTDTRSAIRVGFERGHATVGKFEQVGGFAARCRTGVKNALAVSRCEKQSGKLCAGVLNTNQTVDESGNLLHGTRFFHQHGLATQSSSGAACGAGSLEPLFHGSSAYIDAQRERRLFVQRLK